MWQNPQQRIEQVPVHLTLKYMTSELLIVTQLPKKNPSSEVKLTHTPPGMDTITCTVAHNSTWRSLCQ